MPALFCCSFESDLMCQSCVPWIPAEALSCAVTPVLRVPTLISHDYKTHCKVHLNSGNIAKVLNLCDLQKQAARGVVSVSQRQTSSYHLNCGDWSSDNLDSEFGTACIQNMKQQQRDCVKVWRWISLLIRYVHWGLYCSCGWLTCLIFQVPKNWGRYVAKRLNRLKRKSELQLFQVCHLPVFSFVSPLFNCVSTMRTCEAMLALCFSKWSSGYTLRTMWRWDDNP